jgi:diguanylate cyclase (GGDEF)-like protein
VEARRSRRSWPWLRPTGDKLHQSEGEALEQQLVHQALHDGLTGLANRALFVNRVQHALQRRDRAEKPLALLILDLDDFKDVNDGLGHRAGDEVLRVVADRLRGCLRAADTVARLGGDEFALLFDEIPEITQVTNLAQRLLTAVRAPIPVYGQHIEIHASVGLAWPDPDLAQGAEELLRNAEMAMYGAKRKGKDRLECFVPSMHSSVMQRLELNADLRRAIERGELTVYYQPIVELAGGRIVGVEALARWHHPRRGPINPAAFIALAEETGLIVPIGRFVLEQACAQAARWQRRFPEAPLTLNVNMSIHQLQSPGIVEEVAQVLAETGVEPSRLTLEITETALAEDGDVAAARLWALKKLGVQLAIDDFGTGYSSLSRLADFPIDSLKIPKTFVDGILHGPESSVVARAIIELAHNLGLAVVAEGIEDRQQWQELRRLGCRLGQGFHFGGPITADQVDAMLQHSQLTQAADTTS